MKKIILLFLLLALKAHADEALAPNEKNFLDDYTRAVNSGKIEKIKELVHPENLKCITSENKDFYDNFFEKLSKKNIPEKYDLKIKDKNEKEIKDEMGFLLGPETKIPVMPYRNLILSYDQKDLTPKTGCRKFHLIAPTTHIHSLFIAHSGGAVKFVLGCVGAKVVEMMRNKPIAEKEQKARAEELFKKLDPNVKGKMVTMIRDDLKTLSAIKLYEETAKVTRTEASMVADLVCDELK